MDIYFLWPGPGLGIGSRLCQCESPTAGRDLPIRFCQTLLRPLLALDRFSGSHSPGYPAGSDSPAIRLSLLAYNLGNLWRRLTLPKRIENWSLTSLQQRLVKTGGRLVKHARYYWLFLAEGHLTRRRFGAMLGRIALLPIPTG